MPAFPAGRPATPHVVALLTVLLPLTLSPTAALAAPGDTTIGGTVTVGGLPVEGAEVAVFAQGSGDLGEISTDATGAWQTDVQPGQRVYFRVSAAALEEQWTGGEGRPGLLTDDNSVVVDGPRDDLDTAMRPDDVSAAGFGAVAGERQPFCYRSNVFTEGADSREVAFPVRLGSRTWPAVTVGSDGALSFGSAVTASDRSVLGSRDLPPVIAPLLSTTRTTSDPSAVTYGVSADGRQLCAVWHDLDNRTVDDPSRTNTFQVLLTRPAASSGRASTDVDVRFNYDRVAWGRSVNPSDEAFGPEAGISTSDGSSSGTIRFDGSGRPDAFTTDGDRSLTRGVTASSVPGRHDFSVINGVPGVLLSATPPDDPAPTAPPTPSPTPPTAPTVSAPPVVGGVARPRQRLTASTGVFTGSGLTYTYQWRRDGAAIPGATAAAYTVVPQDAGSALTVLVTAVNGGGSAPAASTPVSIARLASASAGSVKLVTKKITKGKGKKKKTKIVKTYVATVKVTAPGLAASGPATVVVDKKKTLRTTVSNGLATVTLPKLKKGKHTLKVTFAGSEQLTASTSKVITFTTKKI